MKTAQFKKAVEQFKKSGFYIDEYETEKRNLERYKNQLIQENNTYKIDIRNLSLFGGCYTFEDCEKKAKEYFKNGKKIKIKQLENDFIHYDRDFFNSDKIGYSDNLNISFAQLKSLVSDFVERPQFKNIKKNLYCDKWNREERIKRTNEDFKAFIELVLNHKLKVADYNIKEYNEHITFKINNTDLLKAYKKVYERHVLSFFRKPVYFLVSDLKKVLKLTDINRFILCNDELNKRDVIYLYLNVYQWDKVKKLSIDKPEKIQIYADLNIFELNNSRFGNFKGCLNYCNKQESKLRSESVSVLKMLWGKKQ